MVRENLKSVYDKIRKHCEEKNIDADSLKLIAVSKTKPVEMIREAYDCGVRDFGENKVQEILEKYDKLPDDVRWHMIGHLQTNKVKMIIDKVVLIHSVDSLNLAKCIDKEAKKKGIKVNGLIELNLGGEESKYGFSKEELYENIEEIAKLENLCIKGLMTVAPYVDKEEKNREIFKEMKRISVDINTKNIDNVNMEYLSMGMSNDFLVAIEEGATFVRIGSLIFGNR